eukprot:6193275-Pleurochrysis_carterae.AAC.4
MILRSYSRQLTRNYCDLGSDHMKAHDGGAARAAPGGLMAGPPARGGVGPASLQLGPTMCCQKVKYHHAR